MPQRFLRPGITTSDGWNSVSFAAQSLYIRILTLVDDFGRCDGRVPILHGACFALRPDVTPQQTAAFRSELHAAGQLLVYVVDGKEYIQMTRWQERTRSERSRFPEPPQDSAADGSGAQGKDASLVLSHKSSPLHQEPPSRETPSLDQVQAFERQQLPPHDIGFADWWHNEQEGAGWIDAHRRPIAKWKPAYLAARSSNRHSAQEKAARQKTYGRPIANDRTAADREYERTGIKPAHIPTNLL